jgi:hypothetical protein
MDAPLKRHPFLITVLAPVIPHLIGSVFNIWSNMTVIDPLLVAAQKRSILSGGGSSTCPGPVRPFQRAHGSSARVSF